MNMPLAYKYIAIALMLAEINYCADKLHLSIDLSIKNTAIQRAMAYHFRGRDLKGRIDAEEHSFCFGGNQGSERLVFVINLHDDRGEQSLRDYQEALSKKKCMLTDQSFA